MPIKIDVAHFTDDRIAAIQAGSPLTPGERDFLVYDTAKFEECCWFPVQLAAMNDRDLMRTAYDVWSDYASGQV